MSRMLPPDPPLDTPNGERRLFCELRDAKGTDQWVVLHSLDLQRHRRKRKGEADLVVLVPGYGILTVEVKGCRVERKNGAWIYHYQDGPKPNPEGPFKQASGAAEAIRKYAGEKDESLKNLMYSHVVVFLERPFEIESIEWQRWHYLNWRDITQHGIARAFERVLESEHAHLRGVPNARAWYSGEHSRPTGEQVARLTSILRGDYETPLIPGELADEQLRAQQRFTEEQTQALDAMESNPRVLFTGPAGTGKTILALEACRREVAAGRKVLLLCFNALLGDHLAELTDQLPGFRRGGSWAGTFHSYMTLLAGSAPDGHNSEWWTNGLPARCTEILMQAGSDALFDTLIIDEAQDLISDNYADVLDLLTISGLIRGRWRLFGDFEKQAVYQDAAAPETIRDLLARRFGAPNEYRLTINCRNAVKIAQAVTTTCSLKPGYLRHLSEVQGAANPLFWNSPAQQAVLLVEELRQLLKTYRAEQIVVLSVRRDSQSVAGRLAEEGNSMLCPIREWTRSERVGIRYSSVHAFKGLEAAAIVLTDIEDLSTDRAKRLLYVGMTRARLDLRMLMDECCKQQYKSLILESLARAN